MRNKHELNELIEKCGFSIDLPLYVIAHNFYTKRNFNFKNRYPITTNQLLSFVQKNGNKKILKYLTKYKVFEDFPFIDKNFLRENKKKYYAKQTLNDNWLKYTSGTTGRPVEIIYSPEFYFDFLFEEIPYLLNKYKKDLIEYRNNIFCISITDNKESINEVFKHPLDKTGLIIQVVIQEYNYKSISDLFNTINKYRPEIITLKPSICEAIIKHMQTHRQPVKYCPKAFIVSGANFEENIKKSFHSIFETEIIELYGMTEFGIIAYECVEKNGLHILKENVHFEVREEKINNEFSKDTQFKTGELILSSCKNYALPLMRYNTGDIVTINEKPCKCGSKDPRIIKLYGRKGKCFKFSCGELLSPSHFNKIFQISPLIKDFKIIQKDTNSLFITIMTENNVKIEEESVFEFIKTFLPNYVAIKLNFENIVYSSKFERYVTLQE